jgi:hypothetical protein
MLDTLAADLAGHLVEDTVEIHVLVGGEFFVEAGVPEHDAETLAGFVVLHRRIQAVRRNAKISP